MKSSINLALGNKVIRKKSYTVYVYILFALIIAAALVIMAVNIGLKLQYSSLESQGQELNTSLNDQAEKKINMLIVSERTKNITSLYAKRGDLDKRLSELVGIFPSAVTVTGIAAKENEFTLSLDASSLAAVNTVLEEDLPEYLKNTKSGIQMVDISSFVAQGGRYLLTLRFQYPGELTNE